MDKYSIKIMDMENKNIDDIYRYISNELLAKNAAIDIISKLESAIKSLETMPKRFPTRKTGNYARKGYRQVLVGNFIIVYRINELKKEVLVVSVRYSKNNF